MSLVRFKNNTSYPIISAYSDDIIITDFLLSDTLSAEYLIDDGSVNLCFKNPRNKEFLNTMISLYPQKKYILIVKNNFVQAQIV